MDEGGHHAGLMLALHRSGTPTSELTCVSMAEMSQNPFSLLLVSYKYHVKKCIILKRDDFVCGTTCQISVAFVTLLESQQVPERKRRTDATSVRLISTEDQNGTPETCSVSHRRPSRYERSRSAGGVQQGMIFHPRHRV